MDKEEYLSERLEDQIKWYDSKSLENQKTFKRLRTLEIICAAIIPFCSGFMGSDPIDKVVVGLLGVVIAVSAGVMALNKYQENWLTYRTTCEKLKHEKYLFHTCCKPYDDEDSFQLLVQRVEGVISKENSQWSKLTGKKSHNKSLAGTANAAC